MLLLSDRIDEWMMNYLTEFDGKAFQSVAKADESIENWRMKSTKTRKKRKRRLSRSWSVSKPCWAIA